MKKTVLRAVNISKFFSGVQVLKHVDFELYSGETHVLMGENGAGKSTLMKILTGVYQPNEGEIYLADGNGALQKIELPDPKSALENGLSMVFQEFNLMDNLSIAENIFMGYAPVKNGVIDWKTMHREAKKWLDRVRLNVSPGVPVGRLSTAEKQCVEIAKCLSHNAKIIILDEPTSSLSDKEVRTLFELIAELKQQGISVIYISHRMEEIFQIGDRVTVFRDGMRIGTVPIRETTEGELIKMMIGREFNEEITQRVRLDPKIALEAKGIRSRKYDVPVDLTANYGEIVGIFGLVGAGRTELARVLFGIDKSPSGTILKDGKRIELRSPSDAIACGIGLVPEDRKTQGLILRHDVQSNLTLVKLRELSCLRSSRKEEADITERYIQQLSIATSGQSQLVGRLSGGNQQKVAISKWMSLDLEVLIMDEPTRGVDVKAKAEIYETMRKLANKGKCIIMISSDLPEILRVSHRVLVMHEGRITMDRPTVELDQEEIMYAALN